MLARRERARALAHPELVCLLIAVFLILSPLPWDFWAWSGPLQNVQTPARLLPLWPSSECR